MISQSGKQWESFTTNKPSNYIIIINIEVYMNKVYMIILLIFILLVVGACAIKAIMKKSDEAVYKYGFFDKNGKEIIPPIYDGAKEFRENLAPVKTGELWGYVDTAGNIIIKQQFYDARPFYEGMAAVKTTSAYSNKDWGYIDKKGNMVIAPQFYSAGKFSEGIARVTTDSVDRSGFANDQHGYIDTKGNLILSDPGKTTYREDFHFYSEGRFPVVCDSGQFGFMDSEGNLVIKDQFEVVHSFSDGVAAVAIKITSPDMLRGLPILDTFSGDKEKLLWGYIDLKGNWIVKPVLGAAEDFKEGLVLANTKHLSKYAPNGHIYFTTKGENAFSKEFYSAETFSEELACITTESFESYYIDKTGEKKLTLSGTGKLIGGGVFSEGVAYISYKENDESSLMKDGFMDKKGKFLFTVDTVLYYKVQRDFSCGRSWFIKNVTPAEMK